MSPDQKAVFLQLAELGVRPEVAAKMAEREHKKVRPDSIARLRSEQDLDDHQAGRTAADRVQMPNADISAPSAQKTEQAVTATAAILSQRGRAAAAAPQMVTLPPESTLAPVAKSVTRPVIIAEGPDHGGTHESGGMIWRNVEYAGKLNGRKLRDHVDATPASAAPASAAPAAMALAVNGPVAATAADTPATKQRRHDPGITIADALGVAAVVAGVISPPVAIGVAIAHRVAARADGMGGL